jgi:hypothetical protein
MHPLMTEVGSGGYNTQEFSGSKDSYGQADDLNGNDSNDELPIIFNHHEQ